MAIRFQIEHASATCNARVARLSTRHGVVTTPAFCPVGSRGAVKGLLPAQLRDLGTQIVLANAFHLMLRPGAESVAAIGGLHRFMGWDGPILTDSGGYQVHSMSDISAIDEEGVTFRSIVDGSPVRLGPERSMEVQNALGADIIMAFDDCPSLSEADDLPLRARVREAHERTARWLPRCLAAHKRPDDQALFGIVQGGTDPELRRASVEAVCAVELPGYAVGGVAVGESPRDVHFIVELTVPMLPGDKPRYVMGVGYERDLLCAVRAGADLFDCVLPTRNGRNGGVFTAAGRVQIRNSRFRADPGPLDKGCDCPACRGGFTRAYLRHLFVAGEMLGPILLSLHNVRHFQRLLLDIQDAVRDDSWSRLADRWPVLVSEPAAEPAG
jgi:queuine tRNA-ribosyltransferase